MSFQPFKILCILSFAVGLFTCTENPPYKSSDHNSVSIGFFLKTRALGLDSIGLAVVVGPDTVYTKSYTTSDSAEDSLLLPIGKEVWFHAKGYKDSGMVVYRCDTGVTIAEGAEQIIELTMRSVPDSVVDIDGNVYHTVTIGTQVWMVENLKTTRYNDGTAIPLITDDVAWAACSTSRLGAYCWYNNDSAINKATYGGLYNWYAVNTGKLAPTGWHLPTDSEWVVLIKYLGDSAMAGGKLKEVGTTHWLSPNTGATNLSGISALPSGFRATYGAFGGMNSDGRWWSTTANSTTSSWLWGMNFSHAIARHESIMNASGISVWCLKGNGVTLGKHSPIFTSDSTSLTFTAMVGILYKDTLHATDPDRDPLTFSLFTKPAGVTVTDSIISWTPTAADTGRKTVNAMVSDGKGGRDTVGWTIQVSTQSIQPSMQENFNSGIPSTWLAVNPVWLNDTGTVYQTNRTPGTRNTLYYAQGSDWRDYHVEAEMWSYDWYNCCSALQLIYRFVDKQNYCCLQIHSNGSVEFGKAVAGIGIMDTASGRIIIGDSLTWKRAVYAVEVKGNIHKAYRNGKYLCSYIDSTFSTGTVGLEALNIRGYFDNVKVFPCTSSFQNQAPLLTGDSTDLTSTAMVGVTYRDTLYATDPDRDPLIFLLLTKPAGMTIADSIISWVPNVADTGLDTIISVVSDGKGGSDSIRWMVTTRPISAPSISGVASGNGSIRITWSAVTGATAYNLYYTAGNTVSSNGTKVVGATSPYVLSGLTNGTQYAVALSTQISAGESGLGGVKSCFPYSPGTTLKGMRLISGGTFQMGQTGVATPVHQVTISPFYIDTTEVLQTDYQSLMGVNPSKFPGGTRRPVESLSWFDAVLYCNKRSVRDTLDTVYAYTAASFSATTCTSLTNIVFDTAKNGYRLPTEAEYEYAWRGGTTTICYWGDDPNACSDYVWWYNNNGLVTKTVATKLSNPWGLYDMAGNVWQWCNDWYAAYSAIAQVNPVGPAIGTTKILRAGSWGSDVFTGGLGPALRSASRSSVSPSTKSGNFGLRCVRR